MKKNKEHEEKEKEKKKGGVGGKLMSQKNWYEHRRPTHEITKLSRPSLTKCMIQDFYIIFNQKQIITNFPANDFNSNINSNPARTTYHEIAYYVFRKYVIYEDIKTKL